IRCRTSADPMKPAPPVTTILIANLSSSAQVENRQFCQRMAIVREWTFEIFERRRAVVFFRSDNVGIFERPRKGNVGIVPANCAFTRRRVIVGYLIQHRHFVFQRDEAVRKAGGHEKLFAVVARELGGNVFSESRRAASYVDGDVENSPVQYADQLGLRGRRSLKMKAAQRALSARRRLIVLNEAAADAEVTQPSPMKGLAETAAPVGVALGYDGKG